METIDLALNLAEVSNRGLVIGEVMGRLFFLALIIGLVIWAIVKLVQKPRQQGPPPNPYYPNPQWPGQQPYWQGQQPPPPGGQWPPTYPQQQPPPPSAPPPPPPWPPQH